MRLLLLVCCLLVPVAHAGTVLKYTWSTAKGASAENPVLVIEIQDAKVRWEWPQSDGWAVFDTRRNGIVVYRASDRTYDEYAVAVDGERSKPKLQGKKRRAGHECAMYRYAADGAEQEVCLVAATVLGIPAADAAALQLLAESLHALRDAGIYSENLPMAFDGVDGIAVWMRDNVQLAGVERPAVDSSRFEKPDGYSKYQPPGNLGE